MGTGPEGGGPDFDYLSDVGEPAESGSWTDDETCETHASDDAVVDAPGRVTIQVLRDACGRADAPPKDFGELLGQYNNETTGAPEEPPVTGLDPSKVQGHEHLFY